MTTTAARDTSTSTPELTDAARWRALAVCLVGLFMCLLDVSIVNVALPSIRAGISASSSDLQWVLSGYALTFGLALVPSGRLGDAIGRRPLFLTGLVGFTAASAAAGVAQSALMLVVARLVQGVAGGIITPQVSGVIQQLFTGRERARAFGMLGAVIGISTAVGPLLGGLLISIFGASEGWRWIFYVNLPIGIAAVPLALRFVPHRKRPAAERTSQDLDPVGVLLLALGVVAILLPLVEERQWTGSAKWLLVPAGLLLLGALVAWERHYEHRGSQPMVSLALFGVRSYSFGALVGLIYFAGFTAIFFIYTLFLQTGLHYTALEAGATITPLALGTALSSSVGGRTVSRFGRAQVALGLLLVILGLTGAWITVELVAGRGAGVALIPSLLLTGLGSGLVIAPNQSISLSEVPVERAGSATGVLQTGQRIGAAAGIAAVGSVFFSRLASSHGDYASAYRHALLVNIATLVIALAVACADVFAGHRRRGGAHRAHPA